jgi:hypothetical protein
MSNNPPTNSPAAAGAAGPMNSDQPKLRDGYKTGSDRRAEILLGSTGPFRSLLEQYLHDVAPRSYRPGYCTQVRCSLAVFFRYVANELGVEDLDLIRPTTITGYIDWRRRHGFRSGNFLGHLASFFSWLASIGEYDRGNPVIHRFHRELMAKPNPSGLSLHRGEGE